MEYLVESHLGGYYVSSLDPDIITAYCEQCGDSDSIILSWEEGFMMEALINYFSHMKITKEGIIEYQKNGITKQSAIDDTLYSYEEDEIIVENLFNRKIINELEKIILKKTYLHSRKKQISLICNIYPKSSKVLNKKRKI